VQRARPFPFEEAMVLNRRGIRRLLDYYTKAELLTKLGISRPSLNLWLETKTEPKHEAVTRHINDVVASLLKTV
jgi:hypothetical protein